MFAIAISVVAKKKRKKITIKDKCVLFQLLTSVTAFSPFFAQMPSSWVTSLLHHSVVAVHITFALLAEPALVLGWWLSSSSFTCSLSLVIFSSVPLFWIPPVLSHVFNIIQLSSFFSLIAMFANRSRVVWSSLATPEINKKHVFVSKSKNNNSLLELI